MKNETVEIYFNQYLEDGTVCFDDGLSLPADMFQTDMVNLKENTTVEVELIEGSTASDFYSWCENKNEEYINRAPRRKATIL